MTIKQDSTTITIEPNLLIASRFINNRLHSLNVNLVDIQDLIAKVGRISKLDDDTFKVFSGLSKS